MKRIGAYRPVTAFAQSERAVSAALDAPPPSRALTVVQPIINPPTTNLPQRSAAFLAQLLAAKDGVPQARERRRAEPNEVVDAYTRGTPKRPSGRGKLLSVAL